MDHLGRDRTIAGLLGTGLFAFYVTVQFGDFWGWDGRTMATVTHSIADHHTLRLTSDVSWWVDEFPGDPQSPFALRHRPEPCRWEWDPSSRTPGPVVGDEPARSGDGS